ncbi:hypothetical protein ILUMI_05736 [Ignelater luminosus]|uniref:Uncharacterized protein n=1 Tax=Ignelater luminosus TaxID=2038154 RepID=A0A8K0GDA3_IGNLU|nr:hypothetical protein ILUMI_05736 [Ignelater luminosus]
MEWSEAPKAYLLTNKTLKAVFQAYRFASNEYREFPLRFGDMVCRALDADVVGAKKMMAKCGNMSGCTFFKVILHAINNYKMKKDIYKN